MSRRPFRKRSTMLLAAIAAVLAGVVGTAPAQASSRAPGANDRVDVYTGELTAEQLRPCSGAGVDHEDVLVARGAGLGSARGRGDDHRARRPATSRAGQSRSGSSGSTARRPRCGPSQLAGGRLPALQRPGQHPEELLQVAADHPRHRAGRHDRPAASRASRSRPCASARTSRKLKDRKRPAVVYQAAQHAREWITPEMVRRLLHHYVDGYGSERRAHRRSSTPPTSGSSRWSTSTATTTRSPRTTGCGARTCATTTATARSPARTASTSTATSPTSGATTTRARRTQPTDETYRGASPGSEPETQAQIRLFDRVRPKYAINWHSAAQLLLYGVGWQALTSSPDDLIHKAIVGDPDTPGGARATSRSSAPSSTRRTARPTGTWRRRSAR